MHLEDEKEGEGVQEEQWYGGRKEGARGGFHLPTA